MTELIVALDGPEPLKLMDKLWHGAECRWFKLGPRTLAHAAGDWADLIILGEILRVNVFLDLKLVDTSETCRKAVRRFAQLGIAAVSTFTDAATIAALRGAKGTRLKVWRVIQLTDDHGSIIEPPVMKLADGVIMPGIKLVEWEKDFVVPGVRLNGDEIGGHIHCTAAGDCARLGVTHAVVGRPIWAAEDPVVAARAYLEALR